MSIEVKSPKLLVCNCQKTMVLDGQKLGRALGQPEFPVHTELCRAQSQAFLGALREGAPVHVACTQEAALFRELADDAGAGEAPIVFTNIRERAGWCAQKDAALPKMAALLAAATQEAKPVGLKTLASEGICLVYGGGQAALDVASELSGRLGVSLLLTDASDVLLPEAVDVPVAKGRIRSLKGHLGAFEVEVDGYAAMLPSSRAGPEFAMPRDGAKSNCDIVIDLSGGRPLLSDHRRDGYLRADPASPAALAKAMLAAADLVGEFEKPLYVDYDAGICAHARSGKVGCSNCLDSCPTGAITPQGDAVAVDDAICGGCGTCSAVCPTGAVSYAYPQRADVIARARVMLQTYARAGGERPIVLAHDERHGSSLINMIARLGRGLPANVLPLAFNSVMQLGHDLMGALLAAGAEQLVVLVPPEHPEEIAGLESQGALMQAIVSGIGYDGARVRLIVEHDPDAVEDALYGLPRLGPMPAAVFDAKGTKRDIARTVLGKLHEAAPQPQDVIALPEHAPYGTLKVDVDGCTLCLSCVGACPTGALADNPDRPQVSFTEAACVQCGLCVATCPESVISLVPRYNFTPSALTPEIIKTEEPFACIRCSKPFGAKSTIDRVLERLEGHAMFANEAQLKLIQMCDDCRVITLSESENDPFRGADRPRVRTTDDYLEAEAAAKKAGRKPEDFLS